jgi:hypothetical protein
MLQTAGHILLTPGITIPVLDRDPPYFDRARIDKRRLWADCACIQSGSHSQYFEDRSRFIRGSNCTVVLTAVVIQGKIIAIVVQVHARGGSHCQDLAVARICHDDRPILRAILGK